MTLIEAIKSGKPFRIMGQDKFTTSPGPDELVSIYSRDLICDDWEIMEPRIELSSTDIERALIGLPVLNDCPGLALAVSEQLVSKLGFNDLIRT